MLDVRVYKFLGSILTFCSNVNFFGGELYITAPVFWCFRQNKHKSLPFSPVSHNFLKVAHSKRNNKCYHPNPLWAIYPMILVILGKNKLETY